MKTLIIYATKYGATEKIAQSIANHLNNADLHDINSSGTVSLDDYDCIILGSPLTAGQIRKEIKSFAAEYSTQLQSKRLGIFLSALQVDGETEYFKQNFSEELIDNAAAKACLGGIFDPEKCGFFARKIIKAVAKLDTYTTTVDEEKIKLFAQNLVNK